MPLKPVKNQAKILLYLFMMLPFMVYAQKQEQSVAPAEEQPFELLGIDKMLSDLNGAIGTKNTYFKRRNKDGSPKYVHQLIDEIYTMKVSVPGEYRLSLSPAEWFQIEKVTSNEFKVRFTDPMVIWEQKNSNDFKVKWRVDEIVD